MSDNKKSDLGKEAAAGLIGAVIGAAVGAAAVALSDEGNRKKVQKAAEKLEKEGGGKLQELKAMARKFLEESEEQVEEAKEETQKKLPKAKQE